MNFLQNIHSLWTLRQDESSFNHFNMPDLWDTSTKTGTHSLSRCHLNSLCVMPFMRTQNKAIDSWKSENTNRSKLKRLLLLFITAVDSKLYSALTLPCHFSDGVPVWTVPKSPSGELLKNGGLTPLRSTEPSPAFRKRSLSHGAEVRNIVSCCQLSPLSAVSLLSPPTSSYSSGDLML